LLEQSEGVQTQYWGPILEQKTGHTNLLDQTGVVQMQFWGKI
jgi:hypothetical protein